jgi:hypothetical protein
MPATVTALRRTNGASSARPISTQGATKISDARIRRELGHTRRLDIANLQRFRLTWYPPMLQDLERTLTTKRAVEYRASVMTMRYLAMAERRLGARITVHRWTNPYTDTVAVWLEKR